MKSLRQVLLCLLALPSFLHAAGHDVSAVRLTTLPCCSGPYPPTIGSAWDGTRFLTIAEDGSWLDGGLYGSFSDADRSPGSATSFPILIPSRVYLNHLSGGNGEYFAVTTRSSDGLIEFMKLDANGRFQSSVPVYLADAEGQKILSTSYNGKQVLFLCTNGLSSTGSARLSVYDLTGRLVNRTTIPTRDEDHIAVAATADGFVIAAAGFPGGIRTIRVHADGTVATGEMIASGVAGVPLRIAINSDHNRTAVVWMDDAGNGLGATISADGHVGAFTTLPRRPHPPPDLTVSLFAVASGYAVVWNSNPGTSAVRLDENLKLLDTQPVVLGAGNFLGGASAGATINLGMMVSYSSIVTVTASVGPAGFAVGPPIEATTAASQSMTSLAADNIDFVATWLDFSPAGSTARIGHISHSGGALDGAGIPLLDKTSTIAPGAESQLLVTQLTSQGLLATRFSTSGNRLDTAPITIANPSGGTPAIAWNGSGYLLVWSLGSELFESFLDDASSTATPPKRIPLTGPAYPRDQSLIWDGRQFLLAVSVGNPPDGCFCPTPPTAVVLTRIATDGTVLDTPPVVVSSTGRSVLLATSGTEFLVLFGGSSVIVRSTSGGLEVGKEQFLFDHPAGAVTFDGTGYLAAFRYQVFGSAWLAVARINRTGQMSAPLVTQAYVSDLYQLAPLIAVNRAGEAAIAMTEENAPPFHVPRGRIYLLSEIKEEIPSPPQAPRDIVSHFENHLATVMWDSDDASGFVVERSFDQGLHWYTSLTTPGTTRMATVVAEQGNLIRVRAFNAGGMSTGRLTTVGGEPRRRAIR